MSGATTAAISADFALGYRETLLQNLEFEIPLTARVIAAIPDAKREWKPDPKSRTAWELAWHLASDDVIFLEQIAEGRFTFPDARYDQEKPDTPAALAEWYQRRMKDAMTRVRAISAVQLTTPVDFYGMFKFPMFMYLSFMERHSIHHRGQLSTYLRPMGSKVPSIYGGSADEPMEMPS